MSDREFDRAVNDWLEYGSDRTPERAIDGVLLAVKTTPQERDLRIPWRFPQMLALPRATGIAAVAIVAVVGVGGLVFLNNRPEGGTGAPATPPPATQAPTTAPTPSPTPEPSEAGLPPISEWTPFTSAVYGYTMAYPEGWDASEATREWRPGDGAATENDSDFFGTPDNEVAVGVLQMPAGTGADIESVDGLKAWAEMFCNDTGLTDCDTFTDRVEPMCLDAGGDPCRAAILVRSDGKNPEDDGEHVFFPRWPSAGTPTEVIAASVFRGDAYAGAAKYGGSVALLKSFVSTMGVTTPQ